MPTQPDTCTARCTGRRLRLPCYCSAVLPHLRACATSTQMKPRQFSAPRSPIAAALACAACVATEAPSSAARPQGGRRWAPTLPAVLRPAAAEADHTASTKPALLITPPHLCRVPHHRIREALLVHEQHAAAAAPPTVADLHQRRRANVCAVDLAGGGSSSVRVGESTPRRLSQTAPAPDSALPQPCAPRCRR